MRRFGVLTLIALSRATEDDEEGGGTTRAQALAESDVIYHIDICRENNDNPEVPCTTLGEPCDKIGEENEKVCYNKYGDDSGDLYCGTPLCALCPGQQNQVVSMQLSVSTRKPKDGSTAGVRGFKTNELRNSGSDEDPICQCHDLCAADEIGYDIFMYWVKWAKKGNMPHPRCKCMKFPIGLDGEEVRQFRWKVDKSRTSGYITEAARQSYNKKFKKKTRKRQKSNNRRGKKWAAQGG